MQQVLTPDRASADTWVAVFRFRNRRDQAKPSGKRKTIPVFSGVFGSTRRPLKRYGNSASADRILRYAKPRKLRLPGSFNARDLVSRQSLTGSGAFASPVRFRLSFWRAPPRSRSRHGPAAVRKAGSGGRPERRFRRSPGSGAESAYPRS